MKKAIIIIITVLLIALATCTCLYFFTDVFNFLKPTSDNFSIQAKKLFGAKDALSYSDYIESIEKLKTKDESYVSTTNLSFNVNLPSSVVSSSSQRILNNTSIKTTSSYDKSLNASSSNINILYNNGEMFNINSVTKGSTVDVQMPHLYDKALRFDYDKYDSFCAANNIDKNTEPFNSMKSIVDKSKDENNNNNYLYDLLYLTEDEYKALYKNYGTILTDTIDKDNYSSKKNQKITIGDDEIKTTAYSLTLSAKDVVKYIGKIAGKTKDDSTIKDLIVKKYDILNKYMASSASSAYSSKKATTTSELPKNITCSDIETALDKFIEELNETSENELSELKDSIRITIYADRKQNPVRMELAFVGKNDDEDEGTVFFTENLEEGKNTYIIDFEKLSKKLSKSDDLDVTSSRYKTSSSSLSSLKNSISKLTIVDKYSATDTSRKGKITISAKIEDEKQELLQIEYDRVNSKTELKNNISISSPMYSGLSLSFEFGIQGLNEETQKMNLSLYGKLPVGIYSMQVALKADSEVTYGRSDVKEFTDVEDVFSKSGADLQAITDKLFDNASNYLPSKLSTFGINITKEDILLMKEQYRTAESALPAEATQPAEVA